VLLWCVCVLYTCIFFVHGDLIVKTKWVFVFVLWKNIQRIGLATLYEKKMALKDLNGRVCLNGKGFNDSVVQFLKLHCSSEMNHVH
jgi:hypothetical protein